MASLQELIKKAKGVWDATAPYNIVAQAPKVFSQGVDTLQRAVGNTASATPNLVPKTGSLGYKVLEGLEKVQNNIARPFVQGTATAPVGVQSIINPQVAKQYNQNQQLVNQTSTFNVPKQVPLLGGRPVAQLTSELLLDPTNMLPGLGKTVKGAPMAVNAFRKFAPNVALNAAQGGFLTPAESMGERFSNAAVGGALGVAIPATGAAVKQGVKMTKEALSNQAVDVQRQAVKSLLSSTNSRISSAFKSAFSLPDNELSGVLQQFNSPNVGMISGIGSEAGLKQITKRFAPIMADQDITQQAKFWNFVSKVKNNQPLAKDDVPTKLLPMWKKATKDASKFIGQKGNIKLGGFDESNVDLKPKDQEIPKTVTIWNKSKFGDYGAYRDIPVIRREDNITLYQGGKGEGRQFWTPNRKYAEQFGEVTEKTGSFYRVENGNRMTDVYVEVKPELKETKPLNNLDQPVPPKPMQQTGVGEIPQVKTTYEQGATVIRDPSGNIMAYNAVPSPQSKLKVAGTQAKSQAEAAKKEFTEWKRATMKQEGATIPATPAGAAKQVEGQIKKATVGAPARDIESLNDISGFMGQARDVYRNFKAVYGKRFDQVKKDILDPFDASKGKFIDDQKVLLDDLDKNIVRGLGIKKGSKESAAVMQFGEGKRDQASLIKEFGQEGAKKIMQADAYFRGKYDTLLDQVNAIRAKIYPNNPEKIIPKRADYYRHFKEMQDGFRGLANIFETPSGISSKLSGISPDTKPKSKFLSFAQRRKGDRSDIDAVGGFLDYAKTWSYAVNIDPHISRFRALADDLASQTEDGPNAGRLNNFIEYLQDYANDLSGKTHPADRFIQKVIPGGRTAMQALTWVNNRVKANTIVGNAGSMIAQFFNVPQGVASAGVDNSLRGINRTLAGVIQKNTPLDKSNFIKERYASSMYDKFDTGMLNSTKNFVSWVTGVWDEMATKMIWNSHYEKALREGVQNPVKYSDDMTRSMVAGRGIGEQPLIQSSKLFQVAAPFQLEVGNLWHVLGEMKDKKQFGKIATLFVTMYGMNKIAESIRGSDVGFDPIDALIDGYTTFQEEDDKAIGTIKATGRVAGEVISNFPMGQTVGSLYPEYGFKINEAQFPTRKDFFGDADPTRFGSGLLSQQAIENPLYKLIPSYGGGQLQKTIEGMQSYDRGYSETQTGKVRFPIDQNASNAIKSGVFGQYATSNARDFFSSKNKPLGEVQSEEFKEGGGTDYYNEIMEDREFKRVDDKLNEDPEKSFLQKLFNINADVEEADAATSGGRMVKDIFRYRDTNKNTKKFNTAPIPQGSSLADLQARKERVSDAQTLIKDSQLFDSESKITEEEAIGYIEKTGLDPQKIKYGAIDDLDTEGKAQYVDSVLNGEKFLEDEFNNLVDFGVLDTSLIKEMTKQKLIDEKDADTLTDLVKSREIQNGDRKAPKGRKLSIPKTPMGGGVKFSIPDSAKIAPTRQTKTQVGKVNVNLSRPKVTLSAPKRPKLKAKGFKPRPIKTQAIRMS